MRAAGVAHNSSWVQPCQASNLNLIPKFSWYLIGSLSSSSDLKIVYIYMSGVTKSTGLAEIDIWLILSGFELAWRGKD
jgi:hypothetical protein